MSKTKNAKRKTIRRIILIRFDGWYENGEKVSEEETWIDEYGTSRILQARFKTIV